MTNDGARSLRARAVFSWNLPIVLSERTALGLRLSCYRSQRAPAGPAPARRVGVARRARDREGPVGPGSGAPRRAPGESREANKQGFVVLGMERVERHLNIGMQVKAKVT